MVTASNEHRPSPEWLGKILISYKKIGRTTCLVVGGRINRQISVGGGDGDGGGRNGVKKINIASPELFWAFADGKGGKGV